MFVMFSCILRTQHLYLVFHSGTDHSFGPMLTLEKDVTVVKLPKAFWGRESIGVFKPNLHTVETTASIPTNQILHDDKDHQALFEGGPNTPTTNRRRRTAAISKHVKRPYLSNGNFITAQQYILDKTMQLIFVSTKLH